MDKTKLRPCRFAFDVPPDFDGFTDGSKWNGFDNVWVTPETRDAIVKHFEDMGDEEESLQATRDLPVEDGLVCLGWGYATVIVD